MNKGNIKLSLVSFVFAAAVLGNNMQVGASGYVKSLSGGVNTLSASVSKNVTNLSVEELTSKKVSLQSSGAYGINIKDLYLSNSPSVELKISPLTSSKATPYFIVKSNKSLFNALQMQVDSKNKKISIKMKNKNKQYKVSEFIIEVYAPVKAISCEGEYNVDVTSSSISDFSLQSEGEITGTLNISASNSINIDSEGEVNLKLNGSTDKLKCQLEGESKLKLNGSASKLTYQLEGEGTLDAASFKTHDCKLNLEGEGTVSVYADKSFKANAEGEWVCSYAGNPKNVAIDREGESVFKKL